MRSSAPPRSPHTEQRLRLYPAAIVFGIGLGFCLVVATSGMTREPAGPLGGDFPAFYAAGTLVRDGRAEELYDFSAQARAQVGLHPDAPERFLPFAYPPFVAGAYALLSSVDYRAAYVMHTLAMVLALWIATVLLEPLLPRIGGRRFVLFAALLAFYPMFRAVGGQNTALSACLVVIAWRALAENREVLLGLALGLLCYKPQLAVPLIGLVALSGRPVALATASCVVGALYLIGAGVLGLDWPLTWWQATASFHVSDQSGNASHSIGILGFLEAAIGPGHPAALALGTAGTLALSGWLARVWYQARASLTRRMGLACCGLALISPHSMYYEAGLSALGLAALFDEGRCTPRTLAALYAFAYLEPLSELLGVSPLFALVVAITVLLARTADA